MKEEPEQGAGGAPAPDPITSSTLSGPILVASLLLFVSLVWALYDELAGQRPWKVYQRQFVGLYSTYLKKLGPQQAAAEKSVRSSPEFVRLVRQAEEAERRVAPRVTGIQHELAEVHRVLAAVKDPLQEARARVAALTYDLDHTQSARGKQSLRSDIERTKRGPFRLTIAAGGSATDVTFADLERQFNDYKAREGRLNAELAQLTKEPRDLRRQMNEYLSDHLAGLNRQQIDGLLKKLSNFNVEIKQIHVEEAGLVDRCESCHLGIREPVLLTAASMGGRRVFVSHPEKELLTIHDPTRFGCTPCHNGNGLAVSSVRDAHGDYEHWLWPLFAKENAEAGCVQCHFNDRVLDYAPILTRGRDLFQIKGCMGCHRYEGFDREADALSAIRKSTLGLDTQQKDARLEADREIKIGDSAASNEEAQAHYAKAENLRVMASGLDARLEALDRTAKALMQDQKKVGPNLKDVRLKLHREWIPVWLKEPKAFRPGTKMPSFRLAPEEVRALSAFVWQSGLEGPRLPQQPAGDAAAGKELFETRGCLGCHSIGEGERRIGGEFAANLTRLGEKANYDYIVRWVHNPRERTRPYCPLEGRDLGPEDYARHGLKFQFDLDHSSCPNDGRQLQIQNMTVMPSLRLTDAEARDIATYLTSLKRAGAQYPSDTAFMDDPALALKGKQLVTRYGCGGCHELKGFEDVQRIGTELTREASKPIEQLDFGLLERKARTEDWYNHKGFFEHKLRNPAVFDQGREKAPDDLLRMPNFELSDEDRRALTTFLLGSVDSPFTGEFRTIPEQFRYEPSGQQRDVQEGWWIVKKYNCMGCHTIQIGQRSVLSSIPRYQDPDWKEQLPPWLVQEGARVNPDWLLHFLGNPSLSETDTHRNGVRTYLKARMPTFSFSPNELRTLVRFFTAVSAQPQPYLPARIEPLDERERQMARTLFSSPGAPCLKCHLVGDPSHDRFATAPNFLIAKERLRPGWTNRWLLDPQAISPGTAMPSGLFRRDSDHWVFAGPVPASFQGYEKDQAELLVRYMFELTPEEQRRLIQQLPRRAGAATPVQPLAGNLGN